MVVFIDSGDLSQMIIVAENQELFEVPGDTLLDGILHLMATYYVYNVAYPKSCRSLLFFLGHFIEQAKARPTRYRPNTSYVVTI